MSARSWTVALVSVVGLACGGTASVSTRAGALSTPPPEVSGVALERVRMVVERVRVTPVSADSTSTASDDDIGAGPFLIDLAGAELGGTISQAFMVDAPPGEYKKVKFKVHALQSGEEGSHSELPQMLGRSLMVDGTVNGETFFFSSSLDEEQEREGVFVLGEASDNLTLAIDTAGWFSDGAGGLLDPRNPSNKSRIESNIKASIDVFEDDDRDGHED